MRTFWMILIVLLCSCGKKNEREGYGLRKVEIQMASSQLGDLMRSAPQRVDIPALLSIDGEEHGILIQAAGNSTIRESKKSFDLKFINGDPILGAPEVRLATTLRDDSMLRTLLAFEVGTIMGYSMPRIEPVFVYINDRTLGLYFMMEKIDGGFLNRRNISWSRLYSAEDNADYALDMPLRIHRAFKSTPKPDNLSLIEKLVEITHRESDVQFEQEIFRTFDRDDVVNYLAFSTVLNHFDGFNKNMFLVQSKGTDPQLKILPWDFDLVWRPDASVTKPWTPNQLFSRLVSLPSIRSAFEQRVTDLIGGPLSTHHILTRSAFWKERIRRAFDADPILGRQGKTIDHEGGELESQITTWFSQIP